MEILVVALAALATLLIPLVILMAEGAILAVSGVVELAALGTEAWASGSLEAARESRQAKRQSSAVVARWTKWVVYLSAGLAAVTILVMLALNFLFFDWFVRRALAAAQKQNGIAVSFAAADGNLFVGRVHLTDAKLVRTGHDVSDFDLTVADVSVDADVMQLFTGQFVFEDARVTGVRGELIKTGQRDPNMPRRRFSINRLAVDDVAIEVTDRSRPPQEVAVPLEIASLDVANFRSWWAAFDVLFRSTCQGLIDGQPFAISNTSAGDEYETQWQATDLPVHLLSGYFAGPLGWFVDGRIDVNVTTRWRPDDNDPELEMHWRLLAHDFAAQFPKETQLPEENQLPEELAGLKRAVVEPAIAALNTTQENLPIEFDLVMRKDAFEGQLSPFAAGLAEAISQASGTKLKELLPNAADRITDRVDRIRTRIRSMVRERRGAEEEDAVADAEVEDRAAEAIDDRE
jgi:hypothetical protein